MVAQVGARLGKYISTIDEKLKPLVELRVSQIKSCVYCLDLRARQVRELVQKTDT